MDSNPEADPSVAAEKNVVTIAFSNTDSPNVAQPHPNDPTVREANIWGNWGTPLIEEPDEWSFGFGRKKARKSWSTGDGSSVRPVEGNPVVHIDSVHPPDLKMIEASQNHATSLEDIPEEDSTKDKSEASATQDKDEWSFSPTQKKGGKRGQARGKRPIRDSPAYVSISRRPSLPRANTFPPSEIYQSKQSDKQQDVENSAGSSDWDKAESEVTGSSETEQSDSVEHHRAQTSNARSFAPSTVTFNESGMRRPRPSRRHQHRSTHEIPSSEESDGSGSYYTPSRAIRKTDRRRRPYRSGPCEALIPSEVPLLLPSPTPRNDSISALKQRIEASGASFEVLTPVRDIVHGCRLHSTENQGIITISLGGSRYHPELGLEESLPVCEEPFLAKRSFGPPVELKNGRLNLIEIANDLKVFLKTIGKEFGGYPGSCFEDPPGRSSMPPIGGGAPCIMVVEGNPWWLPIVLRQVLPRFPRNLFNSPNSILESNIITPTFRTDRDRALEKVVNDGKNSRKCHPMDRSRVFIASNDSSFNFRIETVDVLPRVVKNGVNCQQCIVSRLGNCEIHRSPISAWYERPSQHKLFSQPLLVVSGDSSSCIPERLSHLYWANKSARRRLARLDALPWWIFPDLLYAFNDWSQVILLMQREMDILDKTFMRDRPKIDILTFTQLRHSFRRSLIALREAHSNILDSSSRFSRLCHTIATNNAASLNSEISYLMNEIPESAWRNLREPSYEVPLVYMGNAGRSRKNWGSRIISAENVFLDRLYAANEQFYYEQNAFAGVAANISLFDNLSFNMEIMRQGDAMQRLNLLALFYLPLSFMATVFGMTNFKLDAVWYPIAAVIALGATALLWSLTKFVMRKWPKFRQRHERKSAASTEKPGLHLTENSSCSVKDAGFGTHMDDTDDETMFGDERPEEEEEEEEKLYQKPATSIFAHDGGTDSELEESESDSVEDARSNKRGMNNTSTFVGTSFSENVYRNRRGGVARSESYAY